MSGSNSDALIIPSLPPSRIEQALRDATVEIYKENPDGLTLKRVRVAAEKKLRLSDAWFKLSSEWNPKSKDIVHSQVERLDNKPGQAAAKPKAARKSNGNGSLVDEQKEKHAPKKRVVQPSSPEVKEKVRKKRKVLGSEPDEESSASLSEDGYSQPSPPPKLKDKPKASGKVTKARKPVKLSKPKPVSQADIESDAEEPSPEPAPNMKDADEAVFPSPEADVEAPKQATKATTDDSSSELSSLIDEPPPPKKKRQRKPSSLKLSKESKAKPRKSESAEPADPNAEEVKRLQGWLVKCGIRKVWGKELLPYSTAREKIAHLKEMLKDAGMDGRYSVDKARQIKEARELAADLEAVKEYDERWGKVTGEQEDEAPRRRGAAKLLVEFSDDEESE